MNSASVVYCLLEVFDVKFELKYNTNLKKRKKELLIAKCVTEIIKTFISFDQFDYEAEIPLDLTNNLQDYYNENDSIDANAVGNHPDDE